MVSNLSGESTSETSPDGLHLEALRRMARVFADTDNLPAAFQVLADTAAHSLQAQDVTLAIDDPQGAGPLPEIHSGPGSRSLTQLAPDAAPLTPGQTLDQTWVGPPDFVAAQARSARRSISAPLTCTNRVFGRLQATRRPGAPEFTDAEKHFLSALANQAALAYEAHRLRSLEARQRRQAETFSETARILSYSLDLQRLLEMILDQVARVVDYDSASIMLLAGEQLSLAAHRKLHLPEQIAIPNQLSAYPHIREVIEQRRPVMIKDTHSDPRWHALQAADNIRCWLGVPLVGRDQVIGVLNLDKASPGFYSLADAGLATTLAHQAAIAIENARLYTREHQRAEQLNALTATIADISSELELSRLLEAILQRAVTLCCATGGDLGLSTGTDGSIRIVASHNLGRNYTGTVLAPGEGAMGYAARSGRIINIAHYGEWEGASPQYVDTVGKAVLAAPFMIGQRVVGVIGIADEDPTRRFSTSDESLLGLFAQHAAIAVHNARLYQEAREAAERRSVLHEVSQAIVGAAMKPEEVFAAIHSAAERLMPAEAFVITRYDPASGEARAVYMVDRGRRFPESCYPSELGLFGKILAGDRSVYIPVIPADEQAGLSHFGTPPSVQSVLAAPMRLRGLVVGMISAQSYQPNDYTDEDRALLEMLASYAAIALDNATLFQNMQHLAITDPLTGLFNRRHLFELGQREFVRARRFNRPLAALMVDIDHFKQVNDRYSHAIGDRVLIRLAQVMRRSIREIDIVGRYGGEEFTLALPEAGPETALEIAYRLHQQVNETFHKSSLPRLTVSIGVASIAAAHKDFNDLVHAADIALYAAKNRGRDQVAVI